MEQQSQKQRPGVTARPSYTVANQAPACELPGPDADGMGTLPASAPLANPYVPFQREGSKQYSAQRGLIRGTLFPGLDLPFMGMVNNREKDTPLAELQALSFAITELGMYLDTHQEDKEALKLFQNYTKLYQQGTAEYEKRYGPMRLMNAGGENSFNWTQDPWPWDYDQQHGENQEG